MAARAGEGPFCRPNPGVFGPAGPGANALGLIVGAHALGQLRTDGAIRLNWRLIHFPPQVIDYVIAHELAHLVELNHSPRFWSLVGELFPDYERVRSMLRHHYDDTPEG